MKLTRLYIDQFQQFRTPLDVTGLEAGLNLFVGPNESGKSTLVRAIRAAFFERHKTGSVTELQPWGDSSAGPEIQLEFDWQGSRWTLNKRFLQSKRCDLQGGGEHYRGDEADDRLAELLGYEFPGRGASKAEHWGIPGLLWVEQGAVQEMREPVGHAGEHLQAALSRNLSEALGDVASTGGDALIARVEQERGKLLTATGRSTGELKQAEQESARLAAEQDRLDSQVDEYRELVDRLGELQRQQREIDAARPWEAQQARAEKARQALDAVQAQQQRQAQERSELDACRRSQQLYRQQLQDMEDQARQLARREEEKARAQQQREQHRANDGGIRQRLEEAKADYARAEEALASARQHARRQALQAEQERLREQSSRLGATLADARRLRDTLQQLSEQHQAIRIDDEALRQLQRTEDEREKLGIQQQALATRLAYRLEDGQQLMLGDQPLSGEGEKELLAAAELRIPGVGTLTVTPGGSDVAELSRRQQRHAADRDALLHELGAASLADAGARARKADELNRRMERERAELKGLAPQGLDALESEQRLAEQRQKQLADELAQLPDAPRAAAPLDEAQAQAALANAGEQLKAAEHAEQAHRQALGLAQQALATAEAEWQSLHDELNAPDRQQRQQQARDALTDLHAQDERLQASLERRQSEIEAANPELLEQDLERFTRAAEAQLQQARGREREVHDLQIRLDTQGAQGLDEQRDDARRQQQQIQRRRDELSRRAEALDLLLTRLKQQRQTVTRRLQAPLQKHLGRYLKLLFPGAELTVDEDLKPEALIRDGTGGEERGSLEALSFGAREQMGLITRLAYADLLKEAGRPTLIILDDALVHCDRARREQMKRILFDAARRHQVLLFTCHPENWQDLGVAPREMQALKTAGSTADMLAPQAGGDAPRPGVTARHE
ncbi:AAA family ATPase [Halomonas piscis]|uniref:AAA family ATPase n=1 Tax=Halomonas piscis TaxID=3031727 RepID=UPI0028A2548B|nr:AAA family ATPase [Halomonas piscis]